jgi:hypothetical protein
MKKLITLILSLFFFSLQLFAVDALIVSDLGVSARSIALGNIEGFSEDSSGLFENPASLDIVKKVSLSVFETKLMQEVGYKNFTMAYRLPVGVVGLGYMYAGIDDIPFTQAAQIDGETQFYADRYFSYLTSMAKLGYQVYLTDKLSIGASGHYYYTELDTLKGSGYNVDVGLKYFHQWFELSFAAKNVLNSYKMVYNNGGVEDFPLRLTGATKWDAYDFSLYFQVSAQRPFEQNTTQIGIEYHPRFFKVMKLYGGAKEFVTLDNKYKTSSLGVGLDLMDVHFDYAFQKADNVAFDNYNYFSLGINF